MGGYPTYSLSDTTGTISLRPHSNPMQFIVEGRGRGTLRCTVPAKPGEDMCGGTEVAL
jgi:hypothetical protein